MTKTFFSLRIQSKGGLQGETERFPTQGFCNSQHENNRKACSVFGTQESYHPRKNFHLKKKWFWVVLETLEKARRETERERPLKRLMGFQRFSPSVFSSPLGLFFLLEVYMDLLQFLIPFLICYVCILPSHGWWAHHTQAHPL